MCWVAWAFTSCESILWWCTISPRRVETERFTLRESLSLTAGLFSAALPWLPRFLLFLFWRLLRDFWLSELFELFAPFALFARSDFLPRKSLPPGLKLLLKLRFCACSKITAAPVSTGFSSAFSKLVRFWFSSKRRLISGKRSACIRINFARRSCSCLFI